MSCLRALSLRVGVGRVTPHAEALLSLYVRTSRAHLKSRNGFDAETLRAAGTLASVLGANFVANTPNGDARQRRLGYLSCRPCCFPGLDYGAWAIACSLRVAGAGDARCASTHR